MLAEGKYSSVVSPTWKTGSARFSAFYKSIMNEPDPVVRIGLCKVARSKIRKQGGLARSREGSQVYSND